MPKLETTRVFWKEHRGDRDQFAQTPKELHVHLTQQFGEFDFDPCPVNPTFNGLEVEWGTNNYVNPPFKDLKPWLTKAIAEWRKGRQVVFLMPVRLHTNYFMDLVGPLIRENLVAMYVIRRGLVFEGYSTRTPFGMMYLHFPGSSSKLEPHDEAQQRRNDRGETPEDLER